MSEYQANLSLVPKHSSNLENLSYKEKLDWLVNKQDSKVIVYPSSRRAKK